MSTILAQARLRACRHWPFASHAVLSMVPVPRPGLGTLAVDKHWRLYYDDAALERFGVEQSAGLILHELDHLLKRHHKRGKILVGDDGANWDTWNRATDAAINADLRLQEIPLPPGLIYPEQFNLPVGLSAEEYYRQIREQNEQQQEPQPDDGDTDEPRSDSADETPENDDDGRDATQDTQKSASGDDESGSPDNGSDAGDAPAAFPGDDSTGSGDARGESDDWDGETQAPGVSGSCSDGRQRPWELGPPDDDNPGLDEADQEQAIHVAAKKVLESEHGKDAGGHRIWAEEVLDPPVDPAAKLLNLVRRSCDLTVGLGERSYRRPSRRNSNPRMALPSNVAPLPRIVVIVDTSGSMGRDDLGLALGMIRKVLNSFRIRDGIRVVTGDAKGQTRQLCLSDPKSIDLSGGGGTNMAKIVGEVLQDRPAPQMVLVCTDGRTPWPTDNPGVPIIACITRKMTELPEYYKPPNWMVTLGLKG